MSVTRTEPGDPTKAGVAPADALAGVQALSGILAALHPDPPSPGCPRFSVLGARRPRWTSTAADGRLRSITLSGRHADILVLLSHHPEGLTADHLAVLLDENDLGTVTVRVEMSRLRKTIGADLLSSRPYRLLAPATSDLADTLAALDGTDIETALSRYHGPLLPRSVSPAIARLRARLSTSIRDATLSSGNLTALRAWLNTPEGRDDRDGWQLLHDSSHGQPALRAGAAGHLAGIDYQLGRPAKL